MHTPVVQRWRDRRGSYRPAGETICTRDYEVTPIATALARPFVLQHHYSASLPAARRSFGLYRGGALEGVAVFSHPCRDDVLTRTFHVGAATDAMELGRFVLLDAVPGNGESWFLARCFAALRREGFAGVLALSDPATRTDAVGNVIFSGHIGNIYQASNARYLGRATRRTLHLLPDGLVLSARAIAKIRARDQGWRYSAKLLEAHGAAPLGESEDAAAWLRRWLPLLTRTFRHPGNYRYAFPLHKAVRVLGQALPYPKFAVGGAAGSSGLELG